MNKRLTLITIISTTATQAAVIVDGQPDISDARLAGWWDASDPASQTALSSGIWPDLSQNGRDATASPGFIPQVEVINGSSVISFPVDSGSFFTFPSIELLNGAESTASIFIVTSSFTTFPGEGALGYALTNSPQSPARLFGRLNEQILFRGNGGQSRFIDEQFFDRLQSINYIGLDGGNSGEITDLRINGVDIPSLLSGGSLIGGAPSYEISTISSPGPASWNGEISEILVFQERLTPAEELQVTSYLSNKYGVAIPEPSSSALAILTLFSVALRRRR